VRKNALLRYLSAIIQRGLVGEAPPDNRLSEGTRPITAFEVDGVLSFSVAPHLRAADVDEEEDGWTVNY
jgi:hypothetical protein